MTYFYLAYGSNLHLGQMKTRCPDAMLVGTGFLKGCELEFRGHNGGCFCTIDLNKKSFKTPVGIFLINDRDLSRLDHYEGYPRLYRREVIPADRVTVKQWFSPDIKLSDSLVYVMNSKEYGIPSRYYYETVRSGYMQCGLDEKFLVEAFQKSANKYRKMCKR